MISQVIQLSVDEVIVGNRHRKAMGDISALAQSIEEMGLLHPIIVRPDRHLVAGERRLAAVQELGWTEVPALMAENLDDAVQAFRAERDENICRLDFAPSEALAVADEIEPLERAEAERRQEATRAKPGERIGEGKLPSPMRSSRKPEEQSRDRIAAAIGMSGRTYERARAVKEAAEAEPERFGPLLAEMDRTRRVNGVFKKLQVQRAAEQIQREPAPLPSGPFRVIVADPPWQYEARSEDSSHRVANPYPSMLIEAIKALPVEIRAHDDCVLWLWTTNAHMREAFEVLDAWGFKQKTILTWVKDRMGTGIWLRGKTEHCLLAIRGNPTIILTNQTTALLAPNEEHSQKPEAFYELVEMMCPTPPCGKLELFARQERDGWITWGNEVPSNAV